MNAPNTTAELCPACRTLALPFTTAIVCDSCLFAAEVARRPPVPSEAAAPHLPTPDFIDPRYHEPARGADRFKKGGPYSSSPYKRGGP